MKFETTIDLPELEIEEKVNTEKENQLIVHNDDHNTFDWVIHCLCSIVKHSSTQAEQCAHIIHFKGKCSVKHGSLEMLKPLKDALVDKGLSVTID